jgi:YVTN family beta-propeller protein
MKRTTILAVIAILVVSLATAGIVSASPAQSQPAGHVVVANRGSGTLSVIDVASDSVVATVGLPGPHMAEPMYVVYSNTAKRVFVGDRANSQVVVIDPSDWSVAGTVLAGAGVFHMWADPQDNQLWVNNDVDNTASVINPRTLEVIATVAMPADLVMAGAKPHDVVLDTNYAYVTLLANPGYVVKFSKRTFQEVGRAAVGIDPHVSLTLTNQNLYVPAQGSNVVTVLDRRTLETVTEIAVPGAHGAGMAGTDHTFYTTNLPGGGVNGLVTIDLKSNTVVGAAVDTPYPVAHNIALARQAEKLYLTHSGATANKVTIYTIEDRIPALVGEATVGINPFGLAFVP